jgi:hypothetical protein
MSDASAQHGLQDIWALLIYLGSNGLDDTFEGGYTKV